LSGRLCCRRNQNHETGTKGGKPKSSDPAFHEHSHHDTQSSSLPAHARSVEQSTLHPQYAPKDPYTRSLRCLPPDGLLASMDAVIEEQILNVPQRYRKMDICHHDQAHDFE
jgi:hypothetical protein